MSQHSQSYARPETLVETEWVADHLADSSVRLVEVDVDTLAYAQGHLPGAIGWNWQTQLEDTVRRDIPTRENWDLLLSAAGISSDTRVILYGDNNNWFAAFAFWLFIMFGHKSVQLMNGGRKKWEMEGRPMTKEVPQYPPTNYRAPEPELQFRALFHEVRSRLDTPDTALVDVRSPQEYTGEVLAPPGLSETAQRGGHIPGAVNIPWAQAVREDGAFKSVDELRQLYAGKGITPDKSVVAYCRIGERSSHTWFVLKYLLGYPSVKNYDGSWTEWGSVIAAPIEK